MHACVKLRAGGRMLACVATRLISMYLNDLHGIWRVIVLTVLLACRVRRTAVRIGNLARRGGVRG